MQNKRLDKKFWGELGTHLQSSQHRTPLHQSWVPFRRSNEQRAAVSPSREHQRNQQQEGEADRGHHVSRPTFHQRDHRVQRGRGDLAHSGGVASNGRCLARRAEHQPEPRLPRHRRLPAVPLSWPRGECSHRLQEHAARRGWVMEADLVQ